VFVSYVLVATRHNSVHHQDARVGRGDEEGHNQNHAHHRQRRQQSTVNHLTKRYEQLIGVGRTNDFAIGSASQFQIDGSSPKDGHPCKTHHGRGKDTAQDELTNRAATRNSGQEQPHKG